MSEKVIVEFNDGDSLNKLNVKAASIKDNLNAAAKASDRVAAPVAAARQGVANKNAATAGGQAAEDSNTARGVGGLTGAAGRDFSAQSRGLGGLVHVYATLAANLFAAGAAFTALNKAANIENMVKGLDQLGAAAGRNLGSVAKGLTQASDGALSLAESMTAVAQASSGGMSSTNILRMGEVAKKASQALGRDMSDAISRLSRGITKLEPELLDELGIMVKIDEASRNYARTLGKTVTSLSDFEKRQGYANAVLEEGERKFGSINLDANPYQKILASIMNITVATGKLINTVLGPLLDILSTSPTALAATLAYITSMLVKQAIPAIGAWRKAMADASIEAAKLSLRINEEFASYKDSVYFKESKSLSNLSTQYKETASSILKTQKWFLDNSKIMGRAIDPTKAFTVEDVNSVKGKINSITKEVVRLNESIPDISKNINLAEVKRIDTKIKMAEVEKGQLQQTLNLMNLSRKYHAEAAAAENEAFNLLDRKVKQLGSEENIQERLAKQARNRMNSYAVLSRVGEDTQVMGLKQGLASLYKNSREGLKEITDSTGKVIQEATPALTGYNKALTNIKGTFLVLTGVVGNFLNAFGVWGAVAGLAVAGFMALDAILSKSNAEAKKFTESLDALASSGDNIDRTLENIAKKKSGEIFSIESMQARTTALSELNDSLKTTLMRFESLQQARGPWEKFWNGAFDLVGKGQGDKLSKSISISVIKAFKAMQEGPAKDAAKTAIEAIVGQKVDLTSVDKFNDSLKDLDETVIKLKGQEIEKLFSKVATSANNAASNLTSSVGILKEIGKVVGDISTSLKPADNFSKAGDLLIQQSFKIGEALTDPISGLLLMKEIAGDLSTLSLLPPGTAQALAGSKRELDALGAQLEMLQKRAENAQKAVEEAVAKRDKYTIKETRVRGEAPRGSANVLDTGVKNAQAVVASIRAETASLEAVLVKASEKWAKDGKQMFLAGTKYLEVGLAKASVEAALITSKSYSDAIKSIGGNTASIDANIARQEIALQEQEIESRYKNTEALFILTNQLELNYTQAEKLRLEGQIKDSGTSETRRNEASEKLPLLEKKEKSLNEAIETAKKGASGITKYMKDFGTGPKSMSSATADVAKILQPLYTSLIGKQIATAKFGPQRGAIDLNEKLGNVSAEFKDRNKDAEAAAKIVANKQAELDIVMKLASGYDNALQSKKETLSREELSNTLLKESLALAERYSLTNVAIAEAKKSSLAPDEKAAMLKELEIRRAQQLNDISALGASASIRVATQENGFLQTRIAGEEELFKIKQENARKSLEYTQTQANASISITESELQYNKSLGFIIEQMAISEQARIEKLKQALVYEKEILANTQARESALNSIDAKIKTSKSSTAPGAEDATRKLEADRKIIKENSAAELAGINATNAARLKGIELIKESNSELAKQEEFTKNIVSLTESLALVFGKVGAGLGGVIGILDRMAKKQTQYAKQAINLEKEKQRVLNDPKKSEEELFAASAAFAKEEQKLNEDIAISQLNNISAISAATKQMFDEKTAAYKVFDAIQTASAVMSMTIQAQQMAQQLAALPGLIAGGVGKLVSQAGFAGLAAAAGFIALMASFGGSSASVSVPKAGYTSAEVQETQGTGTSWKDGKKAENGGGVFGDSEAKSESISNSLEIIKNNTIDGLGYDNKMLKALESIDAGVNNTAKSLYLIPGLRNGSITGAADVTSSSSGIKGLFGKSKTEEIIDSGIEISGSFSQLAKSSDKLIKFYETIRTTTKSSGFFGIGAKERITDTKRYGGDQASIDALEIQITDIFKNASVLFTTVGKKIGMSAITVQRALDSIDIGKSFTSLRGLKGEELEKEFNAVIGSILDSAAGTVFSSMKNYAKFGEGLLETTVRVADGFDKVKVGLDSIGIATSKVGDIDLGGFSKLIGGLFGGVLGGVATMLGKNVEKFTYDVTEAIIEGAGDLENFTSQLTFFSENFLSEAERLVPITKNVTSTMAKLGYATVNTRDEFANLVQSLDLTLPYQRALYQSLMDIAPAFAMVYEATKSTVSAEEKLANLRSQYVDILRLEGKLTKSVALARELELAEMEDYLRVGQKYIWAMEDQADLSAQVTEAYEKESAALENVIKTLDDQISALERYKQSLKTGTQSVLTPAQKYSATKAEALRVAAIANGIAITEAEKQAKNQAISELPTAADAFLQASRTMFASSVQYTADYNAVLDVVTYTSESLQQQKSIAEIQLEVLTNSYNALNIIAESTYTMAQLIPQLLVAQQQTLAASQAYYATYPNIGNTPTPVDTSYSGPIDTLNTDGDGYSSTLAATVAAQTFEIKQMSETIVKLLAGQQQQTDTLAAISIAAAQKAAADAEAARKAADAALYQQWMFSGPEFATGGM